MGVETLIQIEKKWNEKKYGLMSYLNYRLNLPQTKQTDRQTHTDTQSHLSQT